MKSSKSLKIAVVGGGVAGIYAAYKLCKRHHVVLFEANSYLGGHAHAEEIKNEEGKKFLVDTGFLIFNQKTYPLFIEFINEMGIEKKAISAEMSSCFSDSLSGFSYTLGKGIAPFIHSPKCLFQKEIWDIYSDLKKFKYRAVNDLDNKKNLQNITAGDYLKIYSDSFLNHFIWPLTSAIWSLSDGKMQDYPIATLLEYFDNHQLLRGKSEKKWLTFLDSSQVYINAFLDKYSGEVRLHSPVKSVERKTNEAIIETSSGFESFDHVLLATHADVSLKLIKQPTADEVSLLGKWHYKDNPATLHTDTSVLHKNPNMWGSWNMRRVGQEHYHISYYLNRLQKLPMNKPIILTLGKVDVDAKKIINSYSYHHPIFNSESVATQKFLKNLNGKNRISFCGSYFGYGFHEDAILSSKNVVDNINSF